MNSLECFENEVLKSKMAIKFAKKTVKYVKKLNKICTMCEELNIPFKLLIENKTSEKGEEYEI